MELTVLTNLPLLESVAVSWLDRVRAPELAPFSFLYTYTLKELALLIRTVSGPCSGSGTWHVAVRFTS